MRRYLGIMACAIVWTLAAPFSPAKAQCYPGLACPPAPAPQAEVPAARPRTQSGVAPETYRVQDTVSGGVLNMRAEPTADSRLIIAIPASSKGVQISRCAPSRDGASRFDWCSAKWQGYEGWVSSCCILGELSGRKP